MNNLQSQINTAISACEARIENGATIADAFRWLETEVACIFKGEIIYEQ